MVRTGAILFGIGFIIFGILGLIPSYVEQGKLLSLFRVNFEHNILHLTTGIIAILCGLASQPASKMFFLIGGSVYLLLAVFAFMQGGEMLFEMFAVNTPDNILHAIVGAIFIFIGLKTSL